jgi:hypothetical protein
MAGVVRMFSIIERQERGAIGEVMIPLKCVIVDCLFLALAV